MKLPLLIAASLLVLTACGTDEPATTPTTAAPTSEPTPTETTPAGPTSSADLELKPGAIGPVTVGMTKDEALATGLFDADVNQNPGTCEGSSPLVWKDAFTGVDVLTDESESVATLGVSEEDGPRTADGLGVGSTFGELIETYGGDLSAPEDAGYGQVGVFVQDGDRWLGFLFGEAESVDALNNDPGLQVTFAEASLGEKPGLYRDGC